MAIAVRHGFDKFIAFIRMIFLHSE